MVPSNDCNWWCYEEDIRVVLGESHAERIEGARAHSGLVCLDISVLCRHGKRPNDSGTEVVKNSS